MDLPREAIMPSTKLKSATRGLLERSVPAVMAAIFAMASQSVARAAEWPQEIRLAQAAAPGAPAKSQPRGGDGNGGMQRRIEQLEEQLVDMQVTVGTLESLARAGGSGGGPRPSAAGGALFGPSEAARLEGMETQIRALTAEVQRLSNQVRNNGGSQDRGEAGGGSTYAQRPEADQAGQVVRTEQIPSAFGSTVVTPGGDPIGTLIDGGREPPPGARVYGQDTQIAALPPVSSGSAKQDYETAYGHLLKQDYGAAEIRLRGFP